MRIFILLLIALINCTPKEQEKELIPLSFEGKVVGVKDGDTFSILYEGKAQTVRLLHVDCPEKRQPFGSAAKQFASDLCFGKTVRVIRQKKTDRYKRFLAEVFVGSVCVNKALVENGYAWHFTRYSSDAGYAQLEQYARQRKVGLWSEPGPTPPWEWRSARTRATY